MVGSPMATPKFIAPSDQRYACRDCPARCCRVPWQIRFSDEETARYMAEPWIRERIGDEGMAVLETGVLPMREHERRLQCVFLDDDMMCSMQKEFDHAYIPTSCQSFPFGFVAGKGNDVIAQLSQLCPSIRDNYGEPVEGQLKAKMAQRGEVERMSTAMSTVSRVILQRPQYLKVVAIWQEQLSADRSPAETLAALFDRMAAFEEALGEGERASDAMFKKALAARPKYEEEALPSLDKPSFHARALYSYLLGNLCYPSRVRQPHVVGGSPAFQRTRAFANKSAWMRSRGTVDLLFAPKPFKLKKVRGIPHFLGGEHGRIVRDYLKLVLKRGHLFTKPRYLLEAFADLCMATATISRFARCLAVANDREEVTAADVREGISVCELVLISHVTLAEEGQTITKLRQLLLTDRYKLRKLLSSEA
jgi:lysine-N-methylase